MIQEANYKRRNDNYVNKHDIAWHNLKNVRIVWKFWLVIHSPKGEFLH